MPHGSRVERGDDKNPSSNRAEAKTRRCLSQAVREFAQALDAPSENLTAEPSRECREAPFRAQNTGAP